MKKAQEEMIGFALIIILVAVILLVFLSFTLQDTSQEFTESAEVNSFIRAAMQYHSDCERNSVEFLTVQKLIFSCNLGEFCDDGRRTCDVLNSTLSELSNEAWRTDSTSPYSGYEVSIKIQENPFLTLSNGNLTQAFKGSSQHYAGGVDVFFIVYY